MAALVVREAIANAPVGVSGQLRRSIAFSRAKQRGRKVVAQVGFRTKGQAAAMAMEFGRRAGAKPPPAESLLLWVKRVVRPTKDMGHKGKRGRNIGYRNRDQVIRDTAFLIARSIGRKGIKARRFLRNAWAKRKGMARQVIAQHIRKAIAGAKDAL